MEDNFMARERGMVERCVEDNLSGAPEPLRSFITGSYLFKGKKLRPLLTILSHKAVAGGDEVPDDAVTLATGIEFP